MSDLISRQAAIRWVKTECNPYGKPTLDFESGKKVIEHLEQMPSADAVPIKHGEWIEVEVIDDDEPFGVTDTAQCSECGFDAYVDVYWANDNYLYCPNCGAKMDGRKIDDLS